MKKTVFIIAGEASGDVRGSELVSEIGKISPEVSFWGVGGDAMAASGVELIEHIRNLSIVGVWEALRSVFKIKRQYDHITAHILKRKPDLAVLIDYPGFNLKLASFLKKNDIPVIYYIIPQVWAWGKGRIGLIERFVDKALVLFDFEEKLLREHGIDCDLVGHPLVDQIPEYAPECQSVQVSECQGLTIALLPGSRKSEISVLLPIMLETAHQLTSKIMNVRFVLARTSSLDRSLYDKFIGKYPSLNITSVTDDTAGTLNKSAFAMVTSGTATLETALCGVPMIIVYKGSFITYLAFKLFVRIPFIGLANIIAGKEIAPEFLQNKAVPDKLCETIYIMLNDHKRLLSIRNDLREVRISLGEKGAAGRAAKKICAFLQKTVSML